MRGSVFILLSTIAYAFSELAQDISRIESYISHNRNYVKKKFRPHYHIAAPVGWLNDPSGFAFYHGRYHLFYQFHPYNSAWGPMHWGHIVSDNLIDWVYYPVALIPQKPYETSGCFSGCAVTHGNYLILFYTGNTHNDNSTKQTQNMAVSTDGIIFQKYLYNPIIKKPPDGGWQFRHPKVFNRDCLWYMVVGSPTRDHRGRILMYTSADLYSWKLVGTLAESLGDMGYMWENPDFFELDGLQVLLFSAHGIQSDAYQYRNLYQTGYVIGKYNFDTNKFEDTEVSTATFKELDHGHDFYSAHTIQAPDGRRLLIAWMGMWENDFEESIDGWAGMMTLIRELRVSSDSRLLMKPINEINDLRLEILEDATYVPGESFEAGTKSFELLVNTKNVQSEVGLMFLLGKGKRFVIAYAVDHKVMSVDRGGVDGMRRAFWSPSGNGIFWRIFVDASSIEVFCGEGELVFTSRIYPVRKTKITVVGDTALHVVQYKIRRSVGINNAVSRRLLQSYIVNNK